MDENQCSVSLSGLIEEFYALLYRYAYRLTGAEADAEDVVQQTFLTAQRKLHQLRRPENAKAWLFTIARNVYLRELRRGGSSAVVSLESVAEPTDDSPIDAGLESEELQEVLGELPEEFRTPLILFYFGEFSYREIAKQLDVPIGTVMSRLSRAKAWLRGRLASLQPAAAE